MVYEIRKNDIEVNYKERFTISEGVTGSDESDLIATYNNLDDAKQALQSYDSTIREFQTATGLTYDVEEYYIESNEYDEDGEWIGGADIWEYAKFTIRVVETETYNELGRFDNMKDAEDALNAYDGDKKVYLSFSK